MSIIKEVQITRVEPVEITDPAEIEREYFLSAKLWFESFGNNEDRLNEIKSEMAMEYHTCQDTREAYRKILMKYVWN